MHHSTRAPKPGSLIPGINNSDDIFFSIHPTLSSPVRPLPFHMSANIKRLTVYMQLKFPLSGKPPFCPYKCRRPPIVSTPRSSMPDFHCEIWYFIFIPFYWLSVLSWTGRKGCPLSVPPYHMAWPGHRVSSIGGKYQYSRVARSVTLKYRRQ